MKHKVVLFLVLILLIGCSEPTPRKPIARKTSTFLKESIERNKTINKLEEEELQRLMATDSVNTYISSQYGFWYYYKTKDTVNTKLPVKGDKMVYEYKIDNIYDEPIYSKEELGERTYLVDEQELIAGLQEGLKLLKAGEEVVFLFPSHKAYGYSGYQKINGNQPLKYTVNVKSITTK